MAGYALHLPDGYFPLFLHSHYVLIKLNDFGKTLLIKHNDFGVDSGRYCALQSRPL